jgi:hypothetical protein
MLWLGCSGWVWRLGLDLLVQQLRTTNDARRFSNEVLDYECVSLSSCVSTHHRTIAPSHHLCFLLSKKTSPSAWAGQLSIFNFQNVWADLLSITT